MEPSSSHHGMRTPDDHDAFAVIFYNPSQPSSNHPPDQESKARWERLADRIVSARDRLFSRLEAPGLTDLGIPTGAGFDANANSGASYVLDVTTRLAFGIKSSTPESPERELRELLFASICSVLYASGYAAPEELDGIMNIVVPSSKPKYLDCLKRGAKMANEIIAAWAVQEDHTCRSGDQHGHQLQRLDWATQAVVQGTYMPPATAHILVFY